MDINYTSRFESCFFKSKTTNTVMETITQNINEQIQSKNSQITKKQFKFYLKEFLKVNGTQSKNSEYYFANIDFKKRSLFSKNHQE